MCVHIIQRYDDTMKERGAEGRERIEKDKYTQKSTGLTPSCQQALFLDNTRCSICVCMLRMPACTYPYTCA